ncbi:MULTISPECIES: helix-turn-helix domain-containing protein [Enterococcus]|jgi:3-oxoacyl-(acyl-carrier-protein) synthase|uniref:Helix-turn-helix domain-containing protein n=1 Tax=Enterococcus cecorum TaxID=44008 RepID=A0AAW8TSN5_9ENTE|nr:MULTISPECIES: helix-turn-helix domain-containing protein [Enterococcus]EGO2676918.1 helix-turn-helix domain-containing protein [Enterococcus faecalis]EGO2718944.1 helix-turn-helix domain-containing protein [Enterococcus faecalis]EGO2848507.1 helix-turn-helix domain-containing protein [Enterococcus faecalis]EGO5240568.1 helix-turn-helix domain-containing protein [Enterococcus faecalis]EGO7802728.1 helix-turn-helix domain-containing protein [Enterococcus faecalis]
METVKLMISPEQEELFLRQFYQIATKAIEKAEENAGITRDYLNQKEMAEYLNVSENFLKNAVRNEGLPVTTLGARKFYSKKAVNEFMLARMKSGENIER